MLQQTQVATVIPYYTRWISKFPTIRDLASSDIETVNSLWKGLGYYSRASRLLTGAKKVVDELGGHLPDNAADMISKVPGVGRYTAGAICSIAYNQPEPVLDGNVHRLLSRVLALHSNPKAKTTLDVLWNGAIAVVESADVPGDVNQALIELGSTVCKPRDPSCKTCPIKSFCGAYNEARDNAVPEHDIEELCTLCEPLPNGRDGDVTKYPMKAERKKAREETDLVYVIEWRRPLLSSDSNTPEASNPNPASKSKTKTTSSKQIKSKKFERWFLLVRRPEKGLLAGLHEFPTRSNVPASTTSPKAIHEIAHSLLSELLVHPLPAYKPTTIFDTPKPKPDKKPKIAPSPEPLNDHKRTHALAHTCIANIKQAGDVSHIFSHIRKTYRAVWVLLQSEQNVIGPDPEQAPESGSHNSQPNSNGNSKSTHTRSGDRTGPPDLRTDFRVDVSPAPTAGDEEGDGNDEDEEDDKPKRAAKRAKTVKPAKSKASKTKKGGAQAKEVVDDEPSDESASPDAKSNLRWVREEDVVDANIGTGVLKVWKKVNTLWA